VMNVSIATVAKDVGTTVTGIQTAITLYTLVMASLMITGGKIGQIWGRKRAFAIGCVIYGCGSLLTALSQSLPMLLIGWSLLEGIGAALIMPAVVALVASNFGRAERPRAYGLVASAGAIAVAAGPLIGGLFTTYASWRWVFVGEVLVVLIILALARRMDDTPADKSARMDIVGTGLSALGLALVVFGVLRSGTWGLIIPKPGAPEILGLSPVIWLIFVGGCVLAGFLTWERRRLGRGEGVLLDPAMLDNKLLRGGLVSFFFQYLLQAGLFFAVPLFLSVALGLSAIATGVQLLPLSITLLLAAAGVPKVFPNASPRRVVRIGFLSLFASLVILIALLDLGAGPEIITWPMLLAGLGIGALASQLGAITVSAVPDEQSGEVGGLQTPSPTSVPPSVPHSPVRSSSQRSPGPSSPASRTTPASQKRSSQTRRSNWGTAFPSSPMQTCAKHSRMQECQLPPLTPSSRRTNNPGLPAYAPRSQSWRYSPY
jgi:MFS family permease